MMLAPAFLDELRTRTSLSGLIGRTLKLQRAGREWKACCPFHQEKSPSFYVNDDKGFYHCFGCSAHGDAIRWMTEQQGLPFMDAVKELAASAGMDMPAPDRAAAERAERAAGLIDATEAAAGWFAEQLGGIGGAEARAYLDRRGVPAALRAAFGLGFAPDSRGRLKAALDRFGAPLLVEAGLLIAPGDDRPGTDPYDRFRGRLMIPIRDARGRAIAFGGRILGQGEPKYLNSPDTPLFDKGRTLFNLDRAAPAARKAGRVIVVEGYLDVIALAGAGIDEAVAPLGTALTEAQMERLWRLADVPVLCFDGDTAGQKAAVRAAIRALPLIAPGRTLRFALLAQGQDPDDLVRAGGKPSFEKVVAGAIPLDELLWRHELEAAGPLVTPEDRARFGKALRDHARLIGEDFLRKQYLGEFNRRLYEHFDLMRETRSRMPQRGRTERGELPIEMRRIAEYGIDAATFAPAVLRGLARHPALIAPFAEVIAKLAMLDKPMTQVQEAMLRAALGEPNLDTDRLETILKEEALHGFVQQVNRRNDIAFAFLRSNADPARAAADLKAVIEHLVAVDQVRKDLRRLTARLMDNWDETLFAEQTRLAAAENGIMDELSALEREKSGAEL